MAQKCRFSQSSSKTLTLSRSGEDRQVSLVRKRLAKKIIFVYKKGGGKR
eukprot:COSAG06_NODE_70668_length_191_cov_14.260870_1_plen_48_part_10